MFTFLFVLLLPFYACGWNQINISFSHPANTPYFIGQPECNIDGEEFTTIILRIKAERGGPARLFWATNFDPKMNEPKSLSFSIDSSNDFKEYAFNLRRQNPYWTGFIGQVLIFPDETTEGLEIKATAIHDDIITNLKSGWREFFVFEAPQLRSVNFIYGPKVNGVSMNLYLYYLAIISAAFILLSAFIKSQNIAVALKLGAKKTIIICLFLWLALDARILLDQARTVRLDFQTFYGKSLEEKRAAITLGDYYDFLKFADAKIPRGSGFNLLFLPQYYYLEKANYYLYPTHYDKKGDYVLVYNADDQAADYIKAGYKILAVYKKGEYILKK